MNKINYPYLLQLAKASIEHGLLHDAPLFLNPRLQAPEYRENAEVFLSIKVNGANKGCQGNPFKPEKLFRAVLNYAFRSGFRDSRFPGHVNSNMLSNATLEISHLQDRNSWLINDPDVFAKQILPNHTLVLTYQDKQATMLASTQSGFKNLVDLVTYTKTKAKIPNSVPWTDIIGTLINTTTYSKSYASIPCLNID
jgi:AMMECR1 domain-containing protein